MPVICHFRTGSFVGVKISFGYVHLTRLCYLQGLFKKISKYPVIFIGKTPPEQIASLCLGSHWFNDKSNIVLK